MRNLEWDGYFNARDLGGLPTRHSATGATVFGRVARGPRRELITAQGWEDARRWGLSSIVDLRCGYESGDRNGDPEPGCAGPTGIRVVNAPTEDHSNPEFREVCFPIIDSPAYWRHNWRILPHLVRKLLDAVAHAGP